MKKSACIFLIISLILFLSNCATLFKGTSEEVNFNSDPQAADVYVNGQNLGKTPVALKLKVNKTYAIEFRKDGYKSMSYNINNSVGAGWVILDVLAGLIGVIVDAATGAWYSLDQENVNAVLEKQQP
ncbi:PEGA domain-containing protein [Acidobacteriota bacterium]